MVGLGSYRRASILAPTLAFVLAPSGFGQGYVIPATPASSQGVELYYGTRPVARAPLVVSVPSPAPTLHVQPPPYVARRSPTPLRLSRRPWPSKSKSTMLKKLKERWASLCRRSRRKPDG